MPSGKARFSASISDQSGSAGGRSRRCTYLNLSLAGGIDRQRYYRRGFTLIEMMIVMAIIVILIAIAIPYYQKTLVRAKESVLHNNLSAMRNAIDAYSFDKQKAPHDLHDLVSDGYLRNVPKDPITQSSDTWKIIMEDAGQSVSSTDPGIFDVRSGSDKKSLDGTNYADW